MKKKFVFGSIIVALLILVNPLMISQTVKGDDPPNVNIVIVDCDSDPIEKDKDEWFRAELSNEEYDDVTVDVVWRFNGDFKGRQEGMVVPAGDSDWTENQSIHWPDNYSNHSVVVEVWYDGEIIDSETWVFCASHVVVYSFDSFAASGPASEVWETNPAYMADSGLNNYAETTINSDVELLNGNTCPGTDLGTITSVEIRAKAKYSGNKRILMLRPVFAGPGDGSNYEFTDISTTAAWSPWFDITDDDRAPETWDWNQVKDLDCDVEAKTNGMSQFTLYCSKVEIRVCYD